MMQKLVMIGRDYPSLGVVAQKALGPVQACVSAGSDPDSPSFAYKGDVCPNEDGLVVLKNSNMWLLAVADGHLGHHSSHALLDGLAALEILPARLGRLSLLLSSSEWIADTGGGTTLLVACVDESNGQVFGLSFGDSSLVLLGSEGPQIKNQINDTYLRGGGPIEVDQGKPFNFQLQPGDHLLLYTDGVNECCYRDPYRSIGLKHLQQLREQHPEDTALYTRSLMDLALTGVDNHPGGQDNIVIVHYTYQPK